MSSLWTLTSSRSSFRVDISLENKANFFFDKRGGLSKSGSESDSELELELEMFPGGVADRLEAESLESEKRKEMMRRVRRLRGAEFGDFGHFASRCSCAVGYFGALSTF